MNTQPDNSIIKQTMRLSWHANGYGKSVCVRKTAVAAGAARGVFSLN